MGSDRPAGWRATLPGPVLTPAPDLSFAGHDAREPPPNRDPRNPGGPASDPSVRAKTRRCSAFYMNQARASFPSLISSSAPPAT